MFSGIIEKKAKILKIENGVFLIENVFDSPLTLGQSIAHDGACMTIASFDDTTYTFFAMQESLSVTNFGSKKVGDTFNVERCVKVGDRLDGHIVSGHIDTVGTVNKIIKNEDDSIEVFIKYEKKFSKYIIPKGSISINGTSLTVVKDGEDVLSICLIPFTQKITNLGDLKIGDLVNLEFDLVGKYLFKANYLNL